MVPSFFLLEPFFDLQNFLFFVSSSKNKEREKRKKNFEEEFCNHSLGVFHFRVTLNELKHQSNEKLQERKGKKKASEQ